MTAVSSTCVRPRARSHAGQGKQMLDRTHTSKPLVDERPPELREVLAATCASMPAVVSRYGASFLTIFGYTAEFAKRRCDAHGSVNHFTFASLCFD